MGIGHGQFIEASLLGHGQARQLVRRRHERRPYHKDGCAKQEVDGIVSQEARTLEVLRKRILLFSYLLLLSTWWPQRLQALGQAWRL